MPTAYEGKGGRTLVALGALGGALVAGSLALAQPRGRPPHPGPRTKGEGAIEDAGGAATGPVEASAVAVPLPAPAGDGGRLSPLNPGPDEFSDAGPSRSVDYDRLLADIAALRARVAAVGDTLFHSRLAVAVEVRGDHAKLAGLRVSLDDGVIWASPASLRPEDSTVVYEHAVAPGHHAVTIDVDRRDDRDNVFRSSQTSRFVIDVPADRRVAADIALDDDSTIGAAFPRSREGQYDLRVRLRVRAEASSR